MTRPRPFLLGTERTIYVISPQPWDGLMVSKHHYATELAKLGHTVYFIEPPQSDGPRDKFAIRPTATANVNVVKYATFFPYNIKFYARGLFDFLMRRHAAWLAHRIGAHPDLVWDFDNAFQFADLRAFGASRTLLHLVDQVPRGAWNDKGADVMISVSQSILERVQGGAAPRHVLGHNIGEAFATAARRVLADDSPYVARTPIRVGYFGNLNHGAIDWRTIASIAQAHPDIQFELIGPIPDTERGARSPDSDAALRVMQRLPSCHFRGLVAPADLVEKAGEIDLWLLCYDRSVDYNEGANSHKILEYLATGSVSLCSRIEAYVGSPLVQMMSERTNEGFAQAFESLIVNLDRYNAPAERHARARLALEHTYEGAIRKIDNLLLRTDGSVLTSGGG